MFIRSTVKRPPFGLKKVVFIRRVVVVKRLIKNKRLIKILNWFQLGRIQDSRRLLEVVIGTSDRPKPTFEPKEPKFRYV